MIAKWLVPIWRVVGAYLMIPFSHTVLFCHSLHFFLPKLGFSSKKTISAFKALFSPFSFNALHSAFILSNLTHPISHTPWTRPHIPLGCWLLNKDYQKKATSDYTLWKPVRYPATGYLRGEGCDGDLLDLVLHQLDGFPTRHPHSSTSHGTLRHCVQAQIRKNSLRK